MFVKFEPLRRRDKNFPARVEGVLRKLLEYEGSRVFHVGRKGSEYEIFIEVYIGKMLIRVDRSSAVILPMLHVCLPEHTSVGKIGEDWYKVIL